LVEVINLFIGNSIRQFMNSERKSTRFHAKKATKNALKQTI